MFYFTICHMNDNEWNISDSIFRLCPQHEIVWENLTVQEHMLFYLRMKKAPVEIEYTESVRNFPRNFTPYKPHFFPPKLNVVVDEDFGVGGPGRLRGENDFDTFWWNEKKTFSRDISDRKPEMSRIVSFIPMKLRVVDR